MYKEVDEIVGRVEARDSGLLVPVPDRLEVAFRSGTHDSDIEDYEWMLKIDPRTLEGQILDLGSGCAEIFAREMAELGKDVVSLNPRLVYPFDAQKAIRGEVVEQRSMFGDIVSYSELPWVGKSVAALAQELPFGDNSFDNVLAVASVPCYLPRQDYEITVREIERVLRPGGTAYLGPVINFDTMEFSEEEFFEALEKSGVDYRPVEIDDLELYGRPFKRVEINKGD